MCTPKCVSSHLPIDGYLSSFQFGVTMNKTSMNIHVKDENKCFLIWVNAKE